MKTSLDILKYFAELIRKELGIVYQEANYYQLDTRLSEIATQSGCSSVEELYHRALKGLPKDTQRLLFDVATNNETYFYRDPTLFDAIVDTVLEAQSKAQVPFRVWSAACSFGQEIYSLAMLFEKHKDKLPRGYSILATDVSKRAVNAASSGVYTDLQVHRGLTPEHLAQHFNKVDPNQYGGEWQIKPTLKRQLEFQEQNLLASFEKLGRFHFILCRNVLIYQSVERKKEIIARLHQQLEPGGYMVLGSSESMIGLSDDFDMVRTEKATLYKALPKLSKAS